MRKKYTSSPTSDYGTLTKELFDISILLQANAVDDFLNNAIVQ
jgi:hypothetical protein